MHFSGLSSNEKKKKKKKKKWVALVNCVVCGNIINKYSLLFCSADCRKWREKKQGRIYHLKRKLLNNNL